MICQHCGHETESGKFCPNCGSPIEPVEKTKLENEAESSNTEEKSETIQEDLNQPIEPEVQQSSQSTESTNSQSESKQNKKDFSDQLATIFSNFGHFFITLVKQPSQAKKANHRDLYSAIITIVAFVLIISMSAFLPHAFYARRSWFIPVPSLFYEFLMPLILLLITFAGLVSLVFVATKIVKADVKYTDVIGKFGAYLLPFGLLYLAGAIISIGHFPVLPSILISIGILGPIFVISALILYEKETNGFDRIYTLLGLYITEILFIILIGNSLFGGFIGDLFFLLP